MPELMIALVVLGIGLLFIAAALPIGIEYSRRTMDFSTAEAVADYAVRVIETEVRTSRRLVVPDPVNLAQFYRADKIFRPRSDLPSGFLPGIPDSWMPACDEWEPVVKVRPLVTENIGFFGPQRGQRLVDPVEHLIERFVRTLNLQGGDGPGIPACANGGYNINKQPHFEFDVPASFSSPPSPSAVAMLDYPALPGIVRVYPPIDPVTRFRPEDFLNLPGGTPADYPRLIGRTATQPPNYPDYFGRTTTDIPDREREKALSGRMGWTAFYRRAAYGDGSDPLLYEFIVVVTRRPTERHRFAAQDWTIAGPAALRNPRAYSEDHGLPEGGDRLLPSPWLVTFTEMDVLNANNGEYDAILYDPDPADPSVPARPSRFVTTPVERARLVFKCRESVGRLLPVGSVFIPARNDHNVHAMGTLMHPFWGRQAYGFTPSAPDVFPIYEVVDRPDPETVVVRNNGIYPWVVGDNGGAGPSAGWPVWVIPPAFTERDSSGQPVFERQSPVVSVIRKTVRLHEYVE